MEDRFNFRAFLKYSNTMLTNVQNDKDFALYLHSKYYEIMQCTGKTDRKNNLIFENDIVKYFCKKSKTNPEKEARIDYFIIKWCNRGEWCLYTLDGVESLLLGICTDDIEVIGNIYENPELLKVKAGEKCSN